MKREIPPATIIAVIVLAVAALGAAWFFSGNSGQMSAQELDLAKEQGRLRQEREAAAARGELGLGSGGAESEARARQSAQSETGGQ
ncbi:MAG: hypothetical protein KIT11_09600 [Fimbriimonadaceae bacterium]|nr:hypothetical protein [Fimbriimonadaceae bacterium]QYK55581.1 MAG: hypothetical protein KF733_11270 [Fimbriimonadaceae bacterium]